MGLNYLTATELFAAACFAHDPEIDGAIGYGFTATEASMLLAERPRPAPARSVIFTTMGTLSSPRAA
jgi:hypothetical protein